MSFIQITQLTALSLVLTGLIYLWNGGIVKSACKAFPRSRIASYICMGGASIWVLWHISNLGIADFGDYKEYIFVFFASIGLLSFYYVPDFLSVRGASVLVLLIARVILDAGWMDYSAGALILKAFVYISILIALYLAAVPYKLRDFFDWLFESKGRVRTLGLLFSGYGLVLAGVASSM